MTTTTREILAKIEPGTPVEYHGSLTDYHGPATVVSRCHCRHCPWVERGELGTTDVRWELES